MKARLIVWSAIGNTPFTHRGKYYCDVLVVKLVEVKSVAEAKQQAAALTCNTKYGDIGSFDVPESPNQNIRNGLVSRSDCIID